jgi:hypothetical protein
LFKIYRENPEKAINLFKEGAMTDWNLPIADIYRRTGVEFDFSAQIINNISEFILHMMEE